MNMKKVLFVLLLAASFLGCDDGNVSVEAFDFETATTRECGEGTDDFFIYKINGREVLIIELNETIFPNRITTSDNPIVLQIPTAAQVTYRLYDGEVTESTLCSVVPPAQPQVLEEWTATGGTLEITTGVVNPTTTTGSTIITGFSHNLIFRDIVFDRGNGITQRNETILFGSYVRSNIYRPTTFENIDIQSCTANNLLFKSSGLQLLALNLSQETYNSLIVNQATTTGNPRTALLDDNDQVFFNVHRTNLNADLICNNNLPTIEKSYISESGIANQSGIITVETTETAGIFTHTIRFRRVILKDTEQALNFTFGDNYLFGELQTN